MINSRDAEELGLEPGQRVKIVSASNPSGTVDLGDGCILTIAGPVQIVEGMRPGVAAVSSHYGHWAYGSSDVEVDGQVIRGDSRRAGGLSPNMVTAIDPVVKDVCLTGPIGASASFYDTAVRLEPI